MEDMYVVVLDVEDYKYFVFWCRDFVVLFRKLGYLKAKLVVGFLFVVEKYNFVVIMVLLNLVKVLFLFFVLEFRLDLGWVALKIFGLVFKIL